MQTKTCKTCNETKTIDQFGIQRTGKYGVKAHCKSCYNVKPAQSIEYRRLHRYGLSDEAYQELLNSQGGRCATCGVVPERFCIDHDHSCCPGIKTCGECVRGLLCFNCNAALGQVKDDPRILLAMIEYLAGVGE
jgi:hypothetical protein